MGDQAQQETRDRALNAARELFWSEGYEATSLGEVCKRARVNPGSLYYFFRTKEELLLAVLDWYVGQLRPILIDPLLAREQDPIERIFGLLEGYRHGLLLTKFTGGCPIGNLALEVGDSLPRAREKIATNFDGWRSWIRKWLDEAADRLPDDLDRDSASSFVLTVMEGAVMQARAYQSIWPFDACMEQLRNYFNHLLGAKLQPKIQ